MTKDPCGPPLANQDKAARPEGPKHKHPSPKEQHPIYKERASLLLKERDNLENAAKPSQTYRIAAILT